MATHIVLFLKNKLDIDFKTLTAKMQENYKDIGEGIIITKEGNNPNHPNFIFNSNKEILIDGNNHHISINIFNEYENIKEDIIQMLWDAFDYCELEFLRVGYIKEIHETNINIDSIKTNLLNPNIASNSDEFQVAYHNIIKFQRKNINCWKKFIKFYDRPLIINYDINTKEENIKDINYKILKEFIKFADDFINKDLNTILKGEDKI